MTEVSDQAAPLDAPNVQYFNYGPESQGNAGRADNQPQFQIPPLEMAQAMPPHNLFDPSIVQLVQAPNFAFAQPPVDEARKKSQAKARRLAQNRVAARECRRRKKALVEDLQRSVVFFSRANATLKGHNDHLSTLIAQAEALVSAIDKGEIIPQTFSGPKGTQNEGSTGNNQKMPAAEPNNSAHKPEETAQRPAKQAALPPVPSPLVTQVAALPKDAAVPNALLQRQQQQASAPRDSPKQHQHVQPHHKNVPPASAPSIQTAVAALQSNLPSGMPPEVVQQWILAAAAKQTNARLASQPSSPFFWQSPLAAQSMAAAWHAQQQQQQQQLKQPPGTAAGTQSHHTIG